MDYIISLLGDSNYAMAIAAVLAFAGAGLGYLFYKKDKSEPVVTEVVAEPVYETPVVREPIPTEARKPRTTRAKKVVDETGAVVLPDPATVNVSGKKSKRSDKLRKTKEK
jgi:hypothetical protein